MPQQRALVWFKRDLRILDHAALAAAQAHGDALALFIIESDWLQSPECDASHVDFALTCLAELRTALARLVIPLLIRSGWALRWPARLVAPCHPPCSGVRQHRRRWPSAPPKHPLHTLRRASCSTNWLPVSV